MLSALSPSCIPTPLAHQSSLCPVVTFNLHTCLLCSFDTQFPGQQTSTLGFQRCKPQSAIHLGTHLEDEHHEHANRRIHGKAEQRLQACVRANSEGNNLRGVAFTPQWRRACFQCSAFGSLHPDPIHALWHTGNSQIALGTCA